MNCLVIGRGSAGKRHAQALTTLGHEVTIIGHGPNLPQADYYVIATDTPNHWPMLRLLEDRMGKIVIEKPIFPSPTELTCTDTFCAYQLRYALLDAPREALSASAYCGWHLPNWRPGFVPQGVLYDLSHELDYLLWLFGPWIRVTAILSDLAASILLECKRCPQISIHLNVPRS